jgi:hypothetical protein
MAEKLRIDSGNTIHFDKDNTITISERTFKQCVDLCKIRELEHEIENLNTQLSKLREQRMRLESEIEVKRVPMREKRLEYIHPEAHISQYTFRSTTGRNYGLGSEAHRRLGLAYSIAFQSRRMQANYGNMYNPNILAQNCMRIFPRAGAF